jgi:HEAT repeat protein
LRVATRYTVREVRARAVRALGNIGPTALSAAPDLMEAVFAFEDTPSASVAEDAIEALPKLGPGVIPYMLPWLEIVPDDDGEDTKGTWGVAAVVLGKVGAPAVPALIEAMRVPSRRKGAADALGRVGPAAAMAVATLTRVYKQDDDPYLRFSIVEALGSIGSSAAPAVPLLVDAYNNDRDLTRRIETVVALGKIGPAAAAAIPLLEHIASDRGLPRELTTPAKKALRQVRGEQVQ